LLPANTTSDASAQSHWGAPDPTNRTSSTIYSSVTFSLSAASPLVDHVARCSLGDLGSLPPTLATRTAITVPFTLGGHPFDVATVLPASVSFEYTLPPAAQGVWSFGASSGSGGAGLAFEWVACQ
jgi:hypothetical protein